MKQWKQVSVIALLLLLQHTLALPAITGKVQSVDGKPIANAKVVCRLYEGEGKVRKFVTQTDARGQFAFPEAVITPEGFSASLYAVAEGYGVGGCYILSDSQKAQSPWETLPPGKPVTITLFPESILEFRLVDENNQPVRGVKVTVKTVILPQMPSAHEIFEVTLPTWLTVKEEAEELGLTAISDEEGFVRLRHLPMEGVVHLFFEHERFGHIIKPADDNEPEFRLSRRPLTVLRDIVLEEPGEVEGEVRYEDGTPAANVRLFWRNPSGWISGEVTTDEEGRYRISKLQPYPNYEITLHYEEPKAREWIASPTIVNFSIRSGQKLVLPTITLTKGGFLEGFAKDAETGEPVAGVVILVGQIVKQADAPVLNWVARAETDERGYYRVQVPPGEFECYIGAPQGYLPPVEFLPTAPNPYKGVIKLGETTRMDIQLRKGLGVRGKVVDERGQPVANAVVLNMESDFEPQRTTTDENGNFVLTNLQPLKRVRLRAYKGELRTREEVTLFPDDPKAKNIVLRLEKLPLSKVQGRVVDESGNPIPDAVVEVNWIVEFWQGEDGVTFAQASVTKKRMAVTDAQGRFEIVGLWHGDTYSVSVKAEGYSPAWTDKFTLKLGEVKNVGTITLKRAGVTLVGTIFGDEGPLQGVSVYTVTEDIKATRTDRSGKFELSGLAAGKQSLVIREPLKYGWLNLEIEVGEGKDDVRILSVDPIRANVRKVEVNNGELLIWLRPVTIQDDTEVKRGQRVEVELRPPEVGKIAPDLSVQSWLNTKPLTLSALRGKIVVLDFCDWFG